MNEINFIYVNSCNKEELIALLINKIKLFSEIFYVNIINDVQT